MIDNIRRRRAAYTRSITKGYDPLNDNDDDYLFSNSFSKMNRNNMKNKNGQFQTMDMQQEWLLTKEILRRG